MGNIRSFKELKVWQHAMDAAMRVFELTKKFPNEERFSMTDQFRRASRSVATNIAEAWRKRRYPAAFVSKLNDAESQTWTELGLRCGYLLDSEASELDGCYEQILAQLVRMIDHPDDWTVGANRLPRVPASPGPRVNSHTASRIS
jgi:four helix bundle protein